MNLYNAMQARKAYEKQASITNWQRCVRRQRKEAVGGLALALVTYALAFAALALAYALPL